MTRRVKSAATGRMGGVDATGWTWFATLQFERGRLGGRAAVAALGQRGRTTRIPDAVRAPEKAEMRELALRGGPWTEALPTVVAPTAGGNVGRVVEK